MTQLYKTIFTLSVAVILLSCADKSKDTAHNWGDYQNQQYEDNDASYVAPKGFGFCGGEMAICE